MKRILILIAVIISLVATPVLASAYTGIITVSNASATTYTNKPVVFAIDNAAYITAGYFTASMTDVQMYGSGVTPLPFMPTTTQSLFVMPSISPGANSVSMTTGNTPIGGFTFPIIYGKTGQIDCTTVGALNWGAGVAKFSWELSGYFDLTTAGTFFADSNNYFVVSRLSNTSIRIVTGGPVNIDTTGLISGVHTFRVIWDGINYNTYWDTVPKTVTAGNPLSLGTSPAFTLGADNLPYISSFKFSQDDTLTALLVWYQPTTIISGTALPDRSGTANHGVFTFGTSSTSVTAAITSFTPTSQSVSPGGTGGSISLITSLPGAIPNMYVEGSTAGIPGADIINEALVDSGMVTNGLGTDVIEAFWYPLAFAIAIAMGFAAYGWTKQILIQGIVSGVVMACFAGGGVLGTGLLPWLTVVFFVIEVVCIIIIENKYAW